MPCTLCAVPRLFAAAQASKPSSAGVLLLCRYDDARVHTHFSTAGSVLTLGMREHWNDDVETYLGVGAAKPVFVRSSNGNEHEGYSGDWVKLGTSTELKWIFRYEGKDDPAGPLVANYRGEFPVIASRGSLRVECRGYDEAAADAAIRQLEPKIDARLRVGAHDAAWREDLERMQDDLAALTNYQILEGSRDARVDAVGQALARAEREEYDDRRRVAVALRPSAAPLSTWVALDDALEARTVGMLCYPGWSGVTCNLEAQLRVRRAGATLCPVAFSGLAGLTFLAHLEDGSSRELFVQAVSRFAPRGMGAYVLQGADVEHVAPGDTFVVELDVSDARVHRIGDSGHGELAGPYVSHPDAAPTDFVVPVLEIKKNGGASHMFRTY